MKLFVALPNTKADYDFMTQEFRFNSKSIFQARRQSILGLY